MTERQLCVLAALCMIVAVAAGAFGAHGLKGRIDADMLGVWQTGVQYHLIHALGLFAVAWLRARHPQARLLWAAGWLMFAGIVLFSGSLYMLALTGIRWLGAVTPLGGLAFLLAWAMTAWAVWRAPQ
ncbi:DUF423 domain-containing protein [Bordetella sp. FB-8]|uniref:DUF423 domain-containing protein n=1 Tax=Bordetella sp. FB-8 TaxID=1159870 RepID=UPI0003652E56|nr:DUF423 domain-containing protein [Bordetella sp. FB-8]